MRSLDDIDLALLERLQADATVPARVLGEEVGLSTAATQRRINRLRSDGVISSTTAVIDPMQVGHAVSCVVLVRLERDGVDVVDRLREVFRSEPHVQQCFYVAGDADFVLVTLTPNLAEYESLTRRLLLDDVDIRTFTTMAVLDPVKTGQTVPLAIG